MNRSNLSDMDLIEQCKAGNDSAFEVLYHRYRLPLFGYLNKLLPGNPTLVDDIFQQVWCKVLASWDKYSDRQRFLAWLCRIAHNLVVDQYRRDRHLDSGELQEADAVSGYSNSHEDLVDKELWEALDQAIADLPQDQRQVVEYRRMGKSFNEIAACQGSTLNTVLGRMHYAVKKLRACLHEHMV